MQRSIPRISHEAMRCLEQYDWPGNVRELENTIERAVAFETTEEIRVDRLPPKISRRNPSESNGSHKIPETGIDLERHLAEIEKSYIIEALQKTGGVPDQSRGTAEHVFPLLPLFCQKIRHPLKQFHERTGRSDAPPLKRTTAPAAPVSLHPADSEILLLPLFMTSV